MPNSVPNDPEQQLPSDESVCPSHGNEHQSVLPNSEGSGAFQKARRNAEQLRQIAAETGIPVVSATQRRDCGTIEMMDEDQDDLSQWMHDRTKHGVFLLEGETPADIITRLTEGLHNAMNVIGQTAKNRDHWKNMAQWNRRFGSLVAVGLMAVIVLTCFLLWNKAQENTELQAQVEALKVEVEESWNQGYRAAEIDRFTGSLPEGE